MSAVRLITVAGPPSCGKTSVIIKMIQSTQDLMGSSGVVKFDCVRSSDEQRYSVNGIPCKTGLAGNLCPDHYFICNIQECFTWAQENGFSTLVTESAGLCNRCAPHLRNVLAVCVLDNLSGIHTPSKTGPMLRLADIVIVTKSDLVSQAEREVFRFKIQQVNAKANVLFVNGITGQGVDRLGNIAKKTSPIFTAGDLTLRFPMPSALCSYCLGEMRVGEDFQIGLNRKIKL
ncbi:MAG: hypothetical protein GX640_11055 [Fibrobacter sp.]|nr:hypothetical protein [Fibrobacter sp.]